jgi:branched-chain amino acid transport system permease protein
MNTQIALFLVQDGLTNGAIYALLGIATVLVFAVTRVIFVPQGEFVTFGALTLAMLQADKVPGSVWLVLVIVAAVALMDARGPVGTWAPRRVALMIGWPLLMAVAALVLAPMKLPLAVDVLITVALITPMGPLLYHWPTHRCWCC